MIAALAILELPELSSEVRLRLSGDAWRIQFHVAFAVSAVAGRTRCIQGLATGVVCDRCVCVIRDGHLCGFFDGNVCLVFHRLALIAVVAAAGNGK